MRLATGLILAICVLAVSADKAADKVDYSEIINFKYSADVYSGYFNNSQNTESLHYLFFESQNDPETDPLMLWLNGGPGCSSFLGALQENGPWKFLDGAMEATYNEYSWNMNMSVIYLESPAGVGFSWSKVDPMNRTYNDEDVANGNLNALLQWFERFPEYKGRDFYVAGESYGGMYVPWLSAFIDNYNNNKSTPDANKINLKGFAVGNGLTDLRYDFFGQSNLGAELNYFLYRADQAIYSMEDSYLIENVCFNSDAAMEKKECQDLMTALSDTMDGINIYDIYGDCFYSDDDHFTFNYAQFLTKDPLRSKILKMNPPCLDITGPTIWLRSSAVRSAFHIPDYVQPWTECSVGVNENYQVYPGGSIWAYHQLVGKIKTMFFSGDTDAAVPILGTQRWIDQMRIELDLLPYDLWSPWKVPGETANGPQVAGYITVYEKNFTFITVKGAGHMVPQYKPAEAFIMIQNWILDRPF